MYVIIIVLLVIITLSLIMILHKRKEKKVSQPLETDEYEQKLLELIQKEKRMTQKEIRKHFNLSEAKISLLITELEHKQKIEKIKKGRSNIIIIKKN